ncbi:MAG: hypothetical protein QM479_15875 [Pseudomonadota bacterium]
MKIKLILCFLVVFLSACRAPVEEMSNIDPEYSSDGISSFYLQLNCSEAEVTELKESYVKDYCALLKMQMLSTIGKKHPQWQLAATEKQSELFIDAKLEQLYGGNQALRFFLPIEAGRTMLTLHFSVYKNSLLVAERRLTEITRRIHFEDEKYTNEEAISEDSNKMAGYVSDYIDNPTAFDKKMKAYYNGYTPH